MKDKTGYLKVIEWSEEDGSYVGSAPPLIGKCCHGDTEPEVLQQLSVIVDEWLELGGATADFAGKEYRV